MNITFYADAFFREISRSFIQRKWELNENTLLILKFVFLAFIITLAGYIFQKKLKKRSNQTSPFIITKKEEILKILDEALAFRSTFELSFSGTHMFFARCSPVELKQNAIVLELPVKVEPSEEWINRKIFIYITIFQKRGRRYYYFESNVLSFYSKGDFHYLEIGLPNLIEIKQKRKHFRIDVSLWDFEDIKVYFFNEKVNPQPNKLNNHVFVFNKQKAEKDSKVVHSGLSIINISAGGIRLGMTNEFKRMHNFNVENPPYLLLILSFVVEEEVKKGYFLCEVKNYSKDYYTGNIELGLQFVKFGKYESENNIFIWEDVNPDEGIDIIARFVFLKNQELIRKGIT